MHQYALVMSVIIMHSMAIPIPKTDKKQVMDNENTYNNQIPSSILKTDIKKRLIELKGFEMRDASYNPDQIHVKKKNSRVKSHKFSKDPLKQAEQGSPRQLMPVLCVAKVKPFIEKNTRIYWEKYRT